MRVCLAGGDGLFRKGGCVMKKCVKPDVITVHSFRLPTLRERVEEHTRDGMDTLYICPDAWVLRYRFVNRETGETIRARLFAGLGLDGTSEIEIDDSADVSEYWRRRREALWEALQDRQVNGRRHSRRLLTIWSYQWRGLLDEQLVV